MGGLHRRIIDSDKLKILAFVGEEDELSNEEDGLGDDDLVRVEIRL